MKFGEFKKLIDRRNVLMDLNSKYTEIEIKAINKKLEDVSGIPDKIHIKKFYGVLDNFCKIEEDCNIAVVKRLNGVRYVYIADNDQSYIVHSYFPNVKMVKMDFMWARTNMDIYDLMKKYPKLREMLWDCLREEIKYRKVNNEHIRSLVIQ